MRKTKIVCTLGPACREEPVLKKMIASGMNVARLNFSHQDHNFHKENIATLKKLRRELHAPLAILLDTRGPEIRTGILKNGSAELIEGSAFTLTTRTVEGDESICSVNCDRLPTALNAGDRVLLDDGRIALTVASVNAQDILCRVVCGGILGNTRGVNIPSVRIDMPFLSERDKSDLKLGIEQGVDLVAASFVRSAADVEVLRDFLDRNGGGEIQIISKIENSSGIEDFENILALSDGIMVARGDMGVEVSYERLPGIQKRLITGCYRSGKMAITATQMLESMIENPGPTRAEISDVANAVFDSSSAVMLSGETAIGRDPAAVVAAMSRICEKAEADAFSLKAYRRLGKLDIPRDSTEAICDAATSAAEDIDADAIIAVTRNGRTARLMSKYRPDIPIIGATDNEKVFHQLSVNWGIFPMMTETQYDTDRLFAHSVGQAVACGLLRRGDRVVITAGVPLGISGKTNTLKIVEVS